MGELVKYYRQRLNCAVLIIRRMRLVHRLKLICLVGKMIRLFILVAAVTAGAGPTGPGVRFLHWQSGFESRPAAVSLLVFHPHPVVRWQPSVDQTQAWRWAWRREEREGCGYVDWLHRQECAQRHGVLV